MLSGAKAVHLVDLVKSFQTSIYYLVFTCKLGVDTAENASLRVCQKLEKIE